MADHKVQVSTPEHFSEAEHKELQKVFKSTVAGVLKRRRGEDYDPSVENVETTITRRRRRRSAAKSSASKKAGKAAKKK